MNISPYTPQAWVCLHLVKSFCRPLCVYFNESVNTKVFHMSCYMCSGVENLSPALFLAENVSFLFKVEMLPQIPLSTLIIIIAPK